MKRVLISEVGPRDGLQSIASILPLTAKQAWITAEWGESETGRKAKLYSLTQEGREQLDRELASWDRLSTAINLVARMA